MKALTFSTFGPSDVLAYIDIPTPIIKKGELIVEIKAIGLKYHGLQKILHTIFLILNSRFFSQSIYNYFITKY